MRKTLTTGELAKAFEVAPRTASKWIDRGLIRGYRIPGSRDRRVTKEEAKAFAKRNGMPEPEFDYRILIVSKGPATKMQRDYNLLPDVECFVNNYIDGEYDQIIIIKNGFLTSEINRFKATTKAKIEVIDHED